jgi:hypothetical protein
MPLRPSPRRAKVAVDNEAEAAAKAVEANPEKPSASKTRTLVTNRLRSDVAPTPRRKRCGRRTLIRAVASIAIRKDTLPMHVKSGKNQLQSVQRRQPRKRTLRREKP